MIVGEVMYTQDTKDRHMLVDKYSKTKQVQGLIILDIRGPQWSRRCTKDQTQIICQEDEMLEGDEPSDWTTQAERHLLAGIQHQGVQWMEELESLYFHSYSRSSSEAGLKLGKIWVRLNFKQRITLTIFQRYRNSEHKWQYCPEPQDDFRSPDRSDDSYREEPNGGQYSPEDQYRDLPESDPIELFKCDMGSYRIPMASVQKTMDGLEINLSFTQKSFKEGFTAGKVATARDRRNEYWMSLKSEG